MFKACLRFALLGHRPALLLTALAVIVAAAFAFQLGLVRFSSPTRAACTAPGEATVVTDKTDYLPAETVIIDGCSFGAWEGQTLTLTVTRPNGVVDTTTVIVSSGNFTYSYLLDGITGIYYINVLDSGSNSIAATTFTDHTSAIVLIRDPDDAAFADSYTTDTFGVTMDISWTGVPDVTQARFLNDITPEDPCPAFVSEPWFPISEIGFSNTATFPWTIPGNTDSGLRKVCSQTAYGTVGSPLGIINSEDTIFFRRPNPTLVQTCGLDVVIVFDNSGSIDAGEMASAKTAVNSIVTALMPETPTQMALVTFNTSATVAQTFTASESTMTGAVTAVPLTGNFTNWDDGLAKGRTLFPNRAGVSDLMIMVSDGHPNRRGGHTLLTHTAGVSGAVTESAALGWAVAEANQAKLDGIRIISLREGTDFSTNNGIAITGTSVHPPDAVSTSVDVITADFSTLASTLATFAGANCPATINVHKTIDTDGNLGTTGDQSPGAGWTFSCGAAPDTCTPGSGSTNGSGDIVFQVDPGGDNSATASITETLQPAFGFITASCTKNGSPIGTTGANQVTGIGPLAHNDVVDCTFYNTPAAYLTINKVCDPVSDTGLFNLKIDGTTYGADKPCGGSAGPVLVTPGTHTVSETAGTGTNLTNYDSVIGGACAANGSVTLAGGESKTCTITNTRKPTLTVNKACAPGTDTGLFNLKIDGTTYGTDKPCGGTTGPIVLSVGAHTVSETAGTGTNLANYDTVIGSPCSAGGAITLAAGENKTCTITNTRKPTLTVTKSCVPGTDPGLFNLKIDGTTYGTDKACGGTTGPIVLSVGAHTVSETAGTGTNLANYDTAIGSPCSAGGAITLAAGENQTCTITNTRKPTLTVNKACDPVSDPGLFNLKIDGTIYGTDKPCGGTTGPILLSAGPHTVSETAGTGTNLANYASTIGPPCASDGTITLAAGDNKTCTITNKRLGTIIIRKIAVPQSPQDFNFTCSFLGAFQLDDDGANGNPLDSSKTFNSVPPGPYDCTESTVSGWMVGITCTDPDSGTTVESPTAHIDLDGGETVDCAFTNTFVPGQQQAVGGILGLIDGPSGASPESPAAGSGNAAGSLAAIALLALGFVVIGGMAAVRRRAR